VFMIGIPETEHGVLLNTQSGTAAPGSTGTEAYARKAEAGSWIRTRTTPRVPLLAKGPWAAER